MLKKEYDINKIYSLIKEKENIGFEINYRIYQLLEETTYLENSYNQAQEKADNLEPDLAAKFLSYPSLNQLYKSERKLSKYVIIN